MKIALVHDYLSEAGGAERVIRVLSEMYPEAPIYTAFAKNGTGKSMLKGAKIIESKWAWLLKIGRAYSYLRFLIPIVWRSIDLSDYDLVITSCSGYVARGFVVNPQTKIIAYCHTPPRWLYGFDTPTGAKRTWWGKMFMYFVGPFVRYFDFTSAERVDTWIANSREVAKRIEKFYRRESIVVYPPVVMHQLKNVEAHDYYLLVSRIVGGKGIEEVDRAATKANFPLKIVGEVVDHKLVRSLKHYIGRVDDYELEKLYASAKGFIAMAKDEDFGMTVVEAMSSGVPILAYNGGGYKETVISGETGILIDNTTVSAIARGVVQLEKKKWDRARIRRHAELFNKASFVRNMRQVVEKVYA